MDKKKEIIINEMINMSKKQLMGFTLFILNHIPENEREQLINLELENSKFIKSSIKRLEKEGTEIINEILFQAEYV